MTENDLALARRHAPLIRFDRLEPFLPTAVGVSVFEANARSPSSDHVIQLEGDVRTVIEYAIWWDWDIQHLYELEHIWIHLDGAARVVKVESSAHGFVSDATDAGSLPIEEGRIRLYAAPGKHAFAATGEDHLCDALRINACCGPLAGAGNVLVQPMFADGLVDLTICDHHLASKFARDHAFFPSFDFSKTFDLATLQFQYWPELKVSIPGRVRARLAELRAADRGVKAVFLDSGDTLIDEATERYNGHFVETATPIPGAMDMLRELRRGGYLLALVADGNTRSFDSVHDQLGITPYFATRAISEAVGVEKPSRGMFDAAAVELGLEEKDYRRVVHVGNHLRRDIGGANEAGLLSVWMNWSPRRSKEPANDLQKPDWTISHPSELAPVLAWIDADLRQR